MHLEQRFPQKRAFVTGAASGLGLAISKRLAQRGWRLLIADINEERLREASTTLRGLGGEVESLQLNVTDVAALEGAAALLQEKWRGVDMVFNNAGIATAGAIDELTLDDWQRTIDIDLWSVIHGCRIFVPILKSQGNGYIVNTASSAGTLAGPEMAAYNVAKAGVVSLSETLKTELDKDNIGVSVICPTVFVTSLGETMTGHRRMEDNLIRQLKRSKVTADDIVDDMMRSIEKNRLYVITQPDARWGWRTKRFFPELYTRLISYLYRNRKWLYAET
jgi:NAD(P)-dependent dehydrogenase (short-subunit alcohol dehydrogenase family)